MLKQRVITALILAPLALWGIWALPTTLFAVAMGVVFVMGGWEWTRLGGLHHRPGRLVYLLLLAAMMFVGYLALAQQSWVLVILILALMWWTLALMTVVSFPQSGALWSAPSLRRVAGLFVLLPSWLAMVVLHREFGPAYVILLMMLIWGADTGAYFAGRAFGKHKLAPKVSPGKSWEGVIGGMLLALIVAGVATVWLPQAAGVFPFLILVVLTVAVSVLGDLAESLFKRMADLKDSGGLLPGHGGVLDRIDSLTAAAPLFTLGLLWLNQ